MVSLTHFCLKQKSAIQGESPRRSYPPKNISIVMTHSLFPIPVTSPPPLPAPTPASTSSNTRRDNLRLVSANRCLPKGFLVQRHSALSSLPVFEHPTQRDLVALKEPQRFHRGNPQTSGAEDRLESCY